MYKVSGDVLGHDVKANRIWRGLRHSKIKSRSKLPQLLKQNTFKFYLKINYLAVLEKPGDVLGHYPMNTTSLIHFSLFAMLLRKPQNQSFLF